MGDKHGPGEGKSGEEPSRVRSRRKDGMRASKPARGFQPRSSGETRRLPASLLQTDFDHILDEVLATGNPVHIEYKGQLLRLERYESRLSRVKKRDYIVGDPEDLVHFDWSANWIPKL